MKKLTMKALEERIKKLRRDFNDLRDTVFSWGQRDMKELDNLILRIKKLEAKSPPQNSEGKA